MHATMAHNRPQGTAAEPLIPGSDPQSLAACVREASTVRWLQLNPTEDRRWSQEQSLHPDVQSWDSGTGTKTTDEPLLCSCETVGLCIPLVGLLFTCLVCVTVAAQVEPAPPETLHISDLSVSQGRQVSVSDSFAQSLAVPRHFTFLSRYIMRNHHHTELVACPTQHKTVSRPPSRDLHTQPLALMAAKGRFPRSTIQCHHERGEKKFGRHRS